MSVEEDVLTLKQRVLVLEQNGENVKRLRGDIASLIEDNNNNNSEVFRRLAATEKGEAVIANEVKHLATSVDKFLIESKERMDDEDRKIVSDRKRLSALENLIDKLTDRWKTYTLGFGSAVSLIWIGLTTAGGRFIDWVISLT